MPCLESKWECLGPAKFSFHPSCCCLGICQSHDRGKCLEFCARESNFFFFILWGIFVEGPSLLYFKKNRPRKTPSYPESSLEHYLMFCWFFSDVSHLSLCLLFPPHNTANLFCPFHSFGMSPSHAIRLLFQAYLLPNMWKKKLKASCLFILNGNS